MLTDTERAIVKSTVPLLEAGGEALTSHFYKTLLAEHPEVRPMFNQAHQASGEQPRALAHSVLMYARHIDRLEGLGDLPARIVSKHVALQVRPEHYPIVGACLLRAIREVLGAEVATDAVIQAWGAAYAQLADILIGAEEQAYAKTAAAVGGWRGARTFRITHKVAESSEISSFYLAPLDDEPVVDYVPGQYLGLRLVIDGVEQRRNYSLSSAPNGRTYRISVKREASGLVSRYLHDHMKVGDMLDVLPPAGHFTLVDSSKPLVLISGGVGITPLLAMLPQALLNGRPVHFIHCARNRRVHAFRAATDELAHRHAHFKRFYCYEEANGDDNADATGRLDAQQLALWLPETRDIDAYFLGPKSFMAFVNRSLLAHGVPAAQIRYEFFGPASALQ